MWRDRYPPVVGPVVIHTGESLSTPIDCTGSTRIVRIIMPDEWSVARR
jgi:hypothetical protein